MRRRLSSPVSTRRKSPTSAWRRSISTTKKTPETPSRAYKSLFEAAAAEAAAAEAAAGFGAAEAAAWASAGAAAAACLGEVAPSGARLERIAITLTDARLHARI